LANLNRFL